MAPRKLNLLKQTRYKYFNITVNSFFYLWLSILPKMWPAWEQPSLWFKDMGCETKSCFKMLYNKQCIIHWVMSVSYKQGFILDMMAIVAINERGTNQTWQYPLEQVCFLNVSFSFSVNMDRWKLHKSEREKPHGENGCITVMAIFFSMSYT